MLVISLTSIPPRYGQLSRVLEALLAQGADAVALALPRRFARFSTPPLPALPGGITLLRTETDLGPAGKLLPAARAWPEADILYCDDDWLYRPGWAAAFTGPGIIAGATWATERIGRAGGTIAQGFAGVRVPAGIARQIPDPPPAAWLVDDIWLSGHFAGLGLPVTQAPKARAACTPLASPDALQDSPRRDADNRAAAALIHDKFGIWPRCP